MPDTETGADVSPPAVAVASSRKVTAPESAEVRVRVLPDGEFQTALLHGWKGRYLEIEFTSAGISPGQALEIESGDMLYWGEMQRRDGQKGVAYVEHSLDRAALATERNRWD
jgi:hypothetical protein